MSDWTPGKWFTDGDGIVRVKEDAGIMSDPPLRIGTGWREDVWCGENATAEVKANAHLIAAAPDLYEALRRLEVNGHTQATWDLALKAMAKARGEVQ